MGAVFGPGLQLANVAVEKQFDKIPADKVFLTPSEKRQRRKEQKDEARRQLEDDRHERHSRDDSGGENVDDGHRSSREKRRSSDEKRRSRRGGHSSTAPLAAAAAGGTAAGVAFQPPPPPFPQQPHSRSYDDPASPPPPGYSQDAYAQDRGFLRDGYQASGRDGRYDHFDPADPNLSQQRSPRTRNMQSDNQYYPPGSDNRRGYNPSDYTPRDGAYDDRVGYRRDNGSAYEDSYGRTASAGPRGSRYDDEYDDNYRDDERSHRSRHRHRSSRSRSRSSSQEGVRGKLTGHFDKTEHGLAAGALGALAGGVLAHEIGGKKRGVWPTVAGVVIGGLGANAIEARHERKKADRDDDKRRSRSMDAGKNIFSSYRKDADEYDDRRDRRGTTYARDYYSGDDRDDDRRDYRNDRYDRYER